MWLFYILALFPLIIGMFLWIFNKKITWGEWLGGSVAAFILALIMHGIAIVGLTDDIETWSGFITNIEHHPEWVEKYRHAVYRTVTRTTGSGKNRRTTIHRIFSHDETRYTTHSEHWIAYANYGTDQESRQINKQTFKLIQQRFGSHEIQSGVQGFSHGGSVYSGDNLIYKVINRNNWIEPVTTIKTFENRIKAAPTTFSFAKVPPNVKVYEWPNNPNWFVSDRLLGEPNISTLQFDQMNSRLGPRKLVNVIMINFANQSSDIADWQCAKYLGGKKNDLVLCYGQKGTNQIPTWSKVFGWTEKEICKRNLETILLTNPINNDILTLIENEIKKNYIIKDWDKFDYIQIPPRPWAIITYIILLLLSQFSLWVYFHMNDIDKEVAQKKFVYNPYGYR